VQKVHPYRVNAFSSGEDGPLGWVEEGRVRLAQNWSQAQAGWAQRALENSAFDGDWPRVEIVMNYVGASGSTIDALVRDGVRGLVVAATGNATLHHALQAGLERAQQAGLAVRLTTRCPLGRVLALPGSGTALPLAPGLVPVKARVSLMLELLGAQAPAP
jgi:L-asparaginase